MHYSSFTVTNVKLQQQVDGFQTGKNLANPKIMHSPIFCCDLLCLFLNPDHVLILQNSTTWQQ
jgi:hypothetical protein